MMTREIQKPRDGFIDALRALALVRVTIWHALGIPLISWFVTTMPLMFFVAGSLLYASLDGKRVATVLQRRLKRFLIPFWGFGILVVSTLSIADLLSTDPTKDFRIGQLAAWVVPLANPTGTDWEAGWASSPLWYMRAYLWILLLSPVLMMLWRRYSVGLLVGCAAIAFAAQSAASRLDPDPNSGIWIVGDLGIYGFFTLLGFAHRQGRFAQVSPRALAEWIAIAVLATALAWRFFPSSDGVANHSYPALLVWGCAWLGVALLARPALRIVPSLPVLGPVLYWMTRRAMSIYLWHSPCIVAAYWVLNQLDLAPSNGAVLGVMAGFTFIAATATGWLEDLAGGRSAELLPTRTKPNPIQARHSNISVGAGIDSAFASGNRRTVACRKRCCRRRRGRVFAVNAPGCHERRDQQ